MISLNELTLKKTSSMLKNTGEFSCNNNGQGIESIIKTNNVLAN